MNRIIFILFISCLTSISCSNQENAACKVLRTGKFIFKGYGGYLIIRENDYQVEESKKTGDRFKFRVKWLSDCEYQLTFISSSRKLPPEEEKKRKEMVLINSISKVSKDYYVFQGHTKANDFIMRDTLWIVK